MWQAFLRYRALEPEARRLFWRALGLLLFISVSLRMRGFAATRDALQRKLPHDYLEKAGAAPPAEIVEQTCRMVRAAAHYGTRRATCLEQSLALWYLLRKQHVAASLRIGVRKSARKFEAHAWVEHGGVPLNDAEEVHQHYAAFAGEFSGLPGEKT
jgi:hypothetical protein